MIYSLISFFVMASIWGIVGFLQNTTGIDPNAQVKVPPIPGMNQ
jgi:hypothetical protein